MRKLFSSLFSLSSSATSSSKFSQPCLFRIQTPFAVASQYLRASVEHAFTVERGQLVPGGGRGCPISIADASLRTDDVIKPTSFVLDGDPQSSFALRLASDPDLALEVSFRQFEPGTELSLWCLGLGRDVHRDAACRFKLDAATKHLLPVQSDLVAVGIREDGKLQLYPRDDMHCITFDVVSEDSVHSLASSTASSPSSSSSNSGHPLRILSPDCSWLGSGFKSVCFFGDEYPVPALAGRGRALMLSAAANAASFSVELAGPSSSSSNESSSPCIFIRDSNHSDMAFEVSFRQFQIGHPISLWNSSGQRSLACQFSVNLVEGTLSPVQSPALVIGAVQSQNSLILVAKGDQMQLVFDWTPFKSVIGSLKLSLEAQQLVDVVAAQQAVQEETVKAESSRLLEEGRRLGADPAICESLRVNGFVHLVQLHAHSELK